MNEKINTIDGLLLGILSNIYIWKTSCIVYSLVIDFEEIFNF